MLPTKHQFAVIDGDQVFSYSERRHKCEEHGKTLGESARWIVLTATSRTIYPPEIPPSGEFTASPRVEVQAAPLSLFRHSSSASSLSQLLVLPCIK